MTFSAKGDKPMRAHIAKIAAVGLSAGLFAAGCSVIPEHTMAPQAMPENEVEMTSFAHTVNFGGHANVLTAEEQAAIDDFLYRNGVGYGDELVVDFHPDDVAWRAKLNAINNYLKTKGMWAWSATATGAVATQQTASLGVNRYTVVTPDCYAESREPYYRTQDARWPLFGCTTAQNLGVMVASPRDLISPKPDSGPHTYYATRAIIMYRTFFGREALETSPQTAAADIRVINPTRELMQIGENPVEGAQ